MSYIIGMNVLDNFLVSEDNLCKIVGKKQSKSSWFLYNKNLSNELTKVSRLNGVNKKVQNFIIIVIGLSETAISLTTCLLLILCIISAFLEKVATCSLSNVGSDLFTRTFFDS